MPTDKTSNRRDIAEEPRAEHRGFITYRVGECLYRRPREPEEAYRWRSLRNAMRLDQRLDRDSTLRMLKNAREIPDSKFHDIAGLEEAFEARFGGYRRAEAPMGAYEE